MAPTPVDDPHILVVDDDDRIRNLLKRFLQERGYRVSTAPNADKALSTLNSLAFDLLVLDVMMPGMDGFELTQAVRERGETPILLLTARGDAEDRIKGLSLGADDYLPKPFEPEELVLRINAILRRAKPAQAAIQHVIFGEWRFDIQRESLTRAPNAVRDILLLVTYCAVMIYMDWVLFLVVLLIYPTIGLPVTWLGKKLRRLAASMQNQIGDMTSQLTESMRGARMVKTYALEEYERAQNERELLLRLAQGELEIVAMHATDDFGNVINPMIVEGQVHGGLVQGIGQALFENAAYDSNGQLLSGSYMDYCMPRADDVPSFTVDHEVTACTHNVLGVKGCGEAGAIGAPPAVINAITDAIGNNELTMPATPEKVWKALNAVR